MILTGVTNVRSEGLNRVAKLEARKAYGLRNPANSAAGSAPPAPSEQHHTPPPPEDYKQ